MYVSPLTLPTPGNVRRRSGRPLAKGCFGGLAEFPLVSLDMHMREHKGVISEGGDWRDWLSFP